MIRALPEHIIQQIAAGEVLERPANLVKELMENSIDADATSIIVRVGKDVRSFVIEDNGEGIKKGELALALKRHATSKIESAADLWQLDTFGFRGEALACVAAVSLLELQSKAKGESEAYSISSNFGELKVIQTATLNQGTRIDIKDLFSNVPARLKFLKTESAELTQIKKVFKTFALTYPEIHFQLFYDAKLIYDFAPQQLRKHRVANILDLKESFSVFYESDGVKIEAVFSSPSEIQKTPKNLWLFVQNRWIQDRSIQAAIQSAYESLLMHGQYPSVALWIHCDPQDVDVNVHPTKAQVKFRDPAIIFRKVREALRTELLKAPWRKTQTPIAQQSKIRLDPEPEMNKFKSFEFEATQFATKNWQEHKVSAENTEKTLNAILDTYKTDKISDTAVKRQDWEVQPFWSKLQVLGQCNLTYILAQSDAALFLVDQHAAHERIAYEKLMHSWREGKYEQQSYLFPYSISMEEVSLNKIMSMEEDLNKLGFVIQKEDEKTLNITAGPALVKDSAIGRTLQDMAESLLESEDGTHMEHKISNICATIACHSVVRAGQALSTEEMKSLLQQMDDHPLSTFCPHGRPVYIEYGFSSLDKSFGRIV